jgi:peroxiredoxin
MSDSGDIVAGTRAPGFSLPTIDGEALTLESLRGGQHLVLHFAREFT